MNNVFYPPDCDNFWDFDSREDVKAVKAQLDAGLIHTLEYSQAVWDIARKIGLV